MFQKAEVFGFQKDNYSLYTLCNHQGRKQHAVLRHYISVAKYFNIHHGGNNEDHQKHRHFLCCEKNFEFSVLYGFRNQKKEIVDLSFLKSVTTEFTFASINS